MRVVCLGAQTVLGLMVVATFSYKPQPNHVLLVSPVVDEWYATASNLGRDRMEHMRWNFT